MSDKLVVFLTKYSVLFSTIAIIISIGSVTYQIINSVNQNNKTDYLLLVEKKPILNVDSIYLSDKSYLIKGDDTSGFKIKINLVITNSSEYNAQIQFIGNKIDSVNSFILREKLFIEDDSSINEYPPETSERELNYNKPVTFTFDKSFYQFNFLDSVYFHFILVCKNDYGGVYDIYKMIKIQYQEFYRNNIHGDHNKEIIMYGIEELPSFKHIYSFAEKEEFYEFMDRH
jgi:hypothetical protein